MFEAFGLSDPGCVRANNEDYFISDRKAGVFIVADGMGGAKAGEQASKISAERLHEFLQSRNEAENPEILERGFRQANWAVRDAAKDDPDLEGMGTTLVAARVIDENTVQICSVGDSRAYLVAGNEVSLITRDQTWVAEVGTKLGLSEETLKRHPMRHVLTMAVGCAEDLRMHSYMVSLRKGDQILLCSDGLHGWSAKKYWAKRYFRGNL